MAELVAFAGVRGSGSWSTDERPKNFREMMLYLYPNGMMPLTALLSMLPNEPVNDPEYSWWTKTIPDQRTALDAAGDVYTDTNLTAKAQWDYDTAGNNDFGANEVVYVKLGTDYAAQLKKYRAGHIILLRDSANYKRDVRLKVTALGATYLTCKVLVEYKGESTETVALDNTYNTVLIVGNVNEENAVRPTSISYDPIKLSNYTQIARTPLSLSRTARQTKLRTGDAYARMKKEALEIHGMEREKNFIWGVPTENTGTGGLPERTTAGLIYTVKTNAPSNVLDFAVDNAGFTWKEKGEDWFDEKLEQLFRYGSGEKLCLCGSGALLGIQKLIKGRQGSQFQFQSATGSYGIKIVQWVTPFGTVNFKTHPLFSFEATDRYSMLFLETQNLRTRTIQDTMFKADKSETESTGTGRDGKEEEFLTEDGLELHHPETFGMMYNVGVDAN